MKKYFALFLILFSSAGAHAGLTWSWGSLPSNSAASNAIASAMNQAVATFNTYSDYNYNIPVAYNSGVPTAQSSYHGWIEFGGSISARVAMHEMSHWLGTGTTGSWSTYSSGTWAGGYVNNNIEAYDGPNATEGCDGMHYWPYGWNYDNEAVYPERLVGLVGAFLRDQGLDEDRTIGFAPGTYGLRNRYSIKLLDNGGAMNEGAQVKQSTAAGSLNQQWTLGLVSGTAYFTLRSVGNGKLLDTFGNPGEGAPVGLAAENGSLSQQWQILKTDAGYYQIINRFTGKALGSAGQTSDGTGMQSVTPASGAYDQQWKFINVTPAAVTAGLISQYRPVTASSFQTGFLPESATDGKTTVNLTRWTANGGGYPQWWRVDLGALYTVTNVTTYWYPGWSFQYRIDTSTNDIDYTTAVDATRSTVVGTTTNTLSVAARYVRIYATGITPSGGWASFFDCQVFGKPTTPAAPLGLTATPASSRQVNLTWTDSGGVASYTVKRSTTSGGPYTTAAAGVKGSAYWDSGLAVSTTYFYVVSAVNGGGPSADSAQVSVTTPAPTVPLAPTGLSVAPGNNQVVLGWNASVEPASYTVMRSTVNGGPYEIIGNASLPSYVDTTAGNGTTYYYVVTATNAAGESATSAQAAATPAAMYAHWKFNEISGTTAYDSVGGRNATLAGGASWAPGRFGNALALNGTSAYATLPAGAVSQLNGNFSVTAWVYVNVNATWARIFDFGSGTTAYMYVTPVSGGNTIRYAITTSSSAGEQQINGPALVPGAWHHVAVTLSGFKGVLYVDGAPVGTNTTMTLKPANLGNTTQNYIGKSQWSDPYLNGRVDDFRIYNRALSGDEIAALSCPDGVASTPTYVTASPGNNQVSVSWIPVTGALGYRIKRSTTSGGPYTLVGSAITSSYTDATATNGITYYYVIESVNAAGAGSDSAQATATPSDLLAQWKFNESGGTIAADSAGTNKGTLATGASWTIGKFGNAVALNGSSGNVSFPGGLVSALDDFSISTWVFLNANSAWVRLFDFGSGTGKYMYVAPAGSGNAIRYAITTGSANGEQVINGMAVVPVGAWHHVVVTLAGTKGLLYVDGVAVGTNSSMTLKPSSLGSTTQNYLGKSQWSDPYLNGRVDDFRIYRRALKPAEVSYLFTSNGSAPAAPANLTGAPGDGQVILSWDTSTSATGYKVKRSASSGGPYVTIANLASASFVDSSAVNGMRYYYVVSCANIVGESFNSMEIDAMPISAAPVYFSVLRLSDTLNLSWPADHTGWRLQAQTNSGNQGLGTNWFDVSGADATNLLNLPIDPLNGSVFYRLVYP